MKNIRIRLLLPLLPDQPSRLHFGETVEAPVQQQRFASRHPHDPRKRVLLQEIPRLQLLLPTPVSRRIGTRGVRSGVARPAPRRLRRAALRLHPNIPEVRVGIVRIVSPQHGVFAPPFPPLFLEHKVRRVEARQGVRVPEQRVERGLWGQGVAHSQRRHGRIPAAAVRAPAGAASG